MMIRIASCFCFDQDYKRPPAQLFKINHFFRKHSNAPKKADEKMETVSLMREVDTLNCYVKGDYCGRNPLYNDGLFSSF
jgi:hypothetical protein